MIHVENLFWLIAALPLGTWCYRYSRRLLPCIALLLLAIAMSGPYLSLDDEASHSLVLIDQTMSMPVVNSDLCSQLFSSIKLPGHTEYDFFGQNDHPGSNASTDIESELYRAINRVKANGKLFLFSDLLETKGDLHQVTNELATRNIALQIKLPDYYRQNEVILKQIALPGYLRENQPYEMNILIEAGSACDATLHHVNNSTGENDYTLLALEQGLNEIVLSMQAMGQMVDYTFTLESENDTRKENNTLTIQIPIEPKAKISVIGKSVETDLADILGHYAQLDHSFDKKATPDMILITDSDLDTLNPERVKTIKEAVTNGAGLLVLSGQALAHNQLIDRADIAEMLPASLHQQNKNISPDGCIIFIADTSGSMRGARLILAREIIRSTVDRLGDNDKVGVIEFYGNRKWAVPIQYASDKRFLYREINRLTAGGGTVILPALEEAYYGMINTEAVSKHIIVITDGGIETGDYERILSRLRNQNINTTFILTGPMTNAAFLAGMSELGGGRFLYARDRFAVPQIDIKTLDKMHNSSFANDQAHYSFGPWFNLENHMSFESLPEQVTSMDMKLKDNSISILKSDDKTLLAGWQYGLGRVVLSGSDLFSYPGSQSLLQSICRTIYKSPENAAYSRIIIENKDEINACAPDHDLAAKLGQIESTSRIPMKRTIELKYYLLIASLIGFVLQVLHRRMPKQVVVLTGMVTLVLAPGLYADYPAMMTQGYNHYVQEDGKSCQLFIKASEVAKTDDDRLYALAWAYVAAEMNETSHDFDLYLHDHMDGLSANLLAKIYALHGDYDRMVQLNDKIENDLSLADKMKTSLMRQLLYCAITNHQDKMIRSFFQAKNEILPMIKIALVNGNRSHAKSLVNSISPEIPSKTLFEYARELALMGFTEKSIQLGSALANRHDDYYFETVLLLAGLYQQSGDTPMICRLLIEASKDKTCTIKQKYEYALLLEGYESIEFSLLILESIYKATKAYDCKMRMAMLEQKQGSTEKAYQLFYEIWQENDDEYILYEVVPQLLSIAAQTQHLAPLLISLEDRIIAGKAEKKEFNLIIELYLSIDDWLSPIALIRQYPPESKVDVLKQEYQIYRRCGLYRKCSKTLTRLIDQDPTNAIDYLEQLAMVAVELSDKKLGIEVTDSIEQTAGQIGLERRAGILSMMGMHEEAYTIYNQLIHANSVNYELRLLWADEASQISEELKDHVIQQVLTDLNENIDDELFMICVDILLNLDASDNYLQQAYDMTMKRIKDDPGKIYLYRMANDLVDQYAPGQKTNSLMIQATFHAPQRRLILIREAMNRMNRVNPHYMTLAKLLVLMDVKNSPADSMQLGMEFLANGKNDFAQYLFRTNSLLDADNRNNYFTIADLYQRQGRFQQALNLLLEGLALYPADNEFIMETAVNYEILGQYKQAYDLYCQLYHTNSNTSPSAPEQANRKIASVDYQDIARQGILVCSNGQLPDGLAMPKPVRTDQNNLNSLTKTQTRSSKQMPTPTPIPLDQADMALEEMIDRGIVDSAMIREMNDILFRLDSDQIKYLLNQCQDYEVIVGPSESLLYILMRLASKASLGDLSLQYAARCYQSYPANRLIEIKVKDIYEKEMKYAQLAQLLLTYSASSSQSRNFWREMTRIYYLSGDMEKANWANGYSAIKSHQMLNMLDSIFLAYHQNKTETVKQYFRKYQIDCRKQNKYYSLRWNNWDQYLDGTYPSRSNYLYDVLAELPQMQDLYKRYYRVVTKDRRDQAVFEKACLKSMNRIK